MIRNSSIIAGCLIFFIAITGLSGHIKTRPENNSYLAVNWDANTPVYEVLKYFGDTVPVSRPASANEEEIKKGLELFTLGVTTNPEGKKTSRQSKYYVCLNCHNNTKEDPDLRFSDPATRLEYSVKNSLPFLQGTTMYGCVNKVSWYNGDYYKKYGDLVKPANKSLDAAIHLCATVCSQGRDFEEWEMNAVRAYYWSLELKMGDLSLSQDDWNKIKTAASTPGSNQAMVTFVKSFYLSGSPATFGEEPADRKAGYKTGKPGDPTIGHSIYVHSCMKCHNPQGPSQYLQLDESKLSRSSLAKNIAKPGDNSIYHLVRHGTAPEAGHEAYMPHYPLERMSDQQVEDLRAYLEQ